MSRRLLECVPNFSEGREPRVIESVCEAIARVPTALILRSELDADHNRSVVTFVVDSGHAVEAAMAAARVAVERIDMNLHLGVHPRVGAVDVFPFVPLEPVTLEECVQRSVEFGEQLWQELHVPVYLYEAAARRPERRRLECIRKGSYEALRIEAIADESRAPDIGGPALHATAGATVTGARPFLIAYNINLATPHVDQARAIARKIRTSSGGLPAVKSLGLYLASRQQAQVSINLTDFRVTSLATVFRAVQAEAARMGIQIAGSELIGLIPRAALEGTEGLDLRWEQFDESRILENRIAALS